MGQVKTKASFLSLILSLTVLATITCGQSSSIKASDSKVEIAKDHAAASSAAVDTIIKPATDDPNYIIGPEDELIVNVWKEPII